MPSNRNRKEVTGATTLTLKLDLRNGVAHRPPWTHVFAHLLLFVLHPNTQAAGLGQETHSSAQNKDQRGVGTVCQSPSLQGGPFRERVEAGEVRATCESNPAGFGLWCLRKNCVNLLFRQQKLFKSSYNSQSSKTSRQERTNTLFS